jgi:hypothetical protein
MLLMAVGMEGIEIEIIGTAIGTILVGGILETLTLIHHLKVDLETKIGGGGETEKLLGGKREVTGKMVNGFLLMLLTKYKKRWVSKWNSSEVK